MASDASRRKFNCPECVRSFDTASACMQHRKSSHQDKVFECKPCGRAFVGGVALKQHEEAVHGDLQRTEAHHRKTSVPASRRRKQNGSHANNSYETQEEFSSVGTAVAVGVGVAALGAALAGIGYYFGRKDSETDEEQVETICMSSSSSSSSSGDLEPNLVPKGAFGKKFKPHLPETLFNALRWDYLGKSNGACKYCGFSKDKRKLVLHQEWQVDLETDQRGTLLSGTLTFVDFEIVCWNCHDCKHSGWSAIHGRSCTGHLAKVNGWDIPRTEKVLRAHESYWASHQHLTRSQWTYQDNSFWENPIVTEHLKTNPQDRQVIRFGSMCLLGAYNQHPPPKSAPIRSKDNTPK